MPLRHALLALTALLLPALSQAQVKLLRHPTYFKGKVAFSYLGDLWVANEDGTEGNLVAAIINDTADSHTLNIVFGESSSSIEVTVRVPARTTLSLGADDEPLLIEDLDALPGTDLPGFFQSGDAEGVVVSVPVLDGTLDYLAPLAP